MAESLPAFAVDVASAGDGRVRAQVRGDLDLATSPALAEALDHQLASGRSVLVDLSGVTFIDSTGLNTLLRAMRTCEGNGCTLEVAPELPAQVRRLFEITGLTALLPVAQV